MQTVLVAAVRWLNSLVAYFSALLTHLADPKPTSFELPLVVSASHASLFTFSSKAYSPPSPPVAKEPPAPLGPPKASRQTRLDHDRTRQAKARDAFRRNRRMSKRKSHTLLSPSSSKAFASASSCSSGSSSSSSSEKPTFGLSTSNFTPLPPPNTSMFKVAHSSTSSFDSVTSISTSTDAVLKNSSSSSVPDVVGLAKRRGFKGSPLLTAIPPSPFISSETKENFSPRTSNMGMSLLARSTTRSSFAPSSVGSTLSTPRTLSSSMSQFLRASSPRTPTTPIIAPPVAPYMQDAYDMSDPFRPCSLDSFYAPLVVADEEEDGSDHTGPGLQCVDGFFASGHVNMFDNPVPHNFDVYWGRIRQSGFDGIGLAMKTNVYNALCYLSSPPLRQRAGSVEQGKAIDVVEPTVVLDEEKEEHEGDTFQLIVTHPSTSSNLGHMRRNSMARSKLNQGATLPCPPLGRRRSSTLAQCSTVPEEESDGAETSATASSSSLLLPLSDTDTTSTSIDSGSHISLVSEASTCAFDDEEPGKETSWMFFSESMPERLQLISTPSLDSGSELAYLSSDSPPPSPVIANRGPALEGILELLNTKKRMMSSANSEPLNGTWSESNFINGYAM